MQDTIRIIETADFSKVKPSLLVAGDFCPVGILEETIVRSQLKSAFGPFSNLIQNAEVFIVNFECSIPLDAPKLEKCGPAFAASPSIAGELKDAGIDIACLANNHSMDFGRLGLNNTIDTLSSAGVEVVGAGRSEYHAYSASLCCVSGVEVGLLNVAEHESREAIGELPGLALADPIRTYTLIRKVRSQVEYLVVLFHGGHEHYAFPSPRIKELCRFLVEAGADAVICHHSHVISGWELYKSSFISYSVGNFLFPWPPPPVNSREPAPAGWQLGYMVGIGFSRKHKPFYFLVPFAQDQRNDLHLRSLSEGEQAAFTKQLDETNQTICNDALLKERWKEFVREWKDAFINGLLGRPFDGPATVIKRTHDEFRRLVELHNLLSCEAHHDLSLHALEEAIDSTE